MSATDDYFLDILLSIMNTGSQMTGYTSRQVAKKMGISPAAISTYIKTGKVPKPKSVTVGGITVQLWSEKDVERLRKLLPKIANGRKTRYQKLREQQGTQAGTPALRKTSKRKKNTK